MKAREFKVQVSRKVEQTTTIIVSETSAQRARVIAEYEAKTDSDNFVWDSKVINPMQIRSEIIED